MASRSSRSKAQPRSILKSSSHRAKPFNFFGLPRELRDIVYDHSLAYEETWGPPTHGLEVRIIGAPVTSLLLVSRQFGEEYRESVKRNAELTFVDPDPIDSMDTGLSNYEALPKTLRSIDHAHFALWVLCTHSHKVHKEKKCLSTAILRDYLDGIEPLLSNILSAGSSSVTLYFESRGKKPRSCLQALEKEHERLTSLPGLKRLYFAKADSYLSGGPGLTYVFMEWDKKTGTSRSVGKSEGAGMLDPIKVPQGEYHGSDSSDDGLSDYSDGSRLSDYSAGSRLSSHSAGSRFSDYSVGSRLSSHSTGSRPSDDSGSRPSDYSGSDLSDSLGSRLSISSEGGLSDLSGSEAAWSDSEDESVLSKDGSGGKRTGGADLEKGFGGEGSTRMQAWVAQERERLRQEKESQKKKLD